MFSKVSKLLLAVVASGLVSGGALAADVFRVGVMPFVPYSAILLAKSNGWIEEELKTSGHEDVKVVWSQFAGGPSVNEALASKSIDIAALGDTPAIAGHASGIGSRLVGLSYKGGQAQALLVLKNAPYQSVKDLKGKKVATLRGGNVHELLVLILNEAGLTLSDIEYINLSLQDMSTALQQGDIEAALVWDPVFTKLETEGIGRILRDGKGLKNNLNPIVASQAIINEKPGYVKAYLRAAERGADFIKKNPEAAAKELAPIFGLTPEQLQIAFSRSEFAPPVTEEVRDEIKRSIDFMLENRLIRNRVEVAEFDNSKLVAK